MTKQGGLGDQLYVDGFDLSGDVGSLQSIHGGPAALDVTVIRDSARSRIGGKRDGAIDFSSWFDDAAGSEHPVLSTLPRTDRVLSYGRGTVLGAPGACLVGKQIGYDGNRAEDGSFPLKVSATANGFGLEWGVQHTAGKRTDAAATNGTGVDAGAASAFGLQAYLQVFSFVGTDVTVKLQESSDNAVGDPYADVAGGAFAVINAGNPAPHAERIATAAIAVERWLRVVTTTSAGFTSLTFAVVVARNPIAVVF